MFCVAGVAHMTLGWLWRAFAPLVARGAAALCVAGVALGDRPCVAGVALVTLGWHRPSFCASGVALADIDLRFAW